MTLKQNLLTGSDEVQVTTANSASGGTAFSSVGGVVKFDTAQHMHGTTAGRLNTGANASYVAYSGFSTTQFAARAYVYYGSFPAVSANQNLIQIRSGSTVLNGFDFGDNDHRFSFRTPTGVGYFVSPAAISLNTWYRVEIAWNISATGGSVNARVYLGDSTTALWQVNPTAINTGTAPITEVRFGSNNSATSMGSTWLDEVAARDASVLLIGPYSTAAPTVNATASVTGTSISLGAQVTTFDGLAPSYAWSQTAGPTVSLSSSTASAPTVASAPAGDYTFRVVVTDSSGKTATDTVNITVQSTGGSQPPSATAPTAVVSMYHDVFAIDATQSTASTNNGALSYTVSPSSGLTTLKPGIWVGLSPSVATQYTVQVTEVGATSPAVSVVTVPAKPTVTTASSIQILVANNDASSGGTFV